jgi:mono/diheme cytochrome c family protein
LALLAVAVPAMAGDAQRGAVLFTMAGGCGCHTPDGGPVGAGGRAIPTPFGKFYGTNITPDPETGIGRWSDAEIIAAIREGNARGTVEAPVMPYTQYAGMADADVADLVAHLRTLAPVRRSNQPAEVQLPFPRLAYRGWRLLFGPSDTPPAAAPTDPLARGRYVVDHVAICPGIRDWSEQDIVRLLSTGMKPDMDNVQGEMEQVVDGFGGGPGLAHAPDEELRSIAKYLKTVPPIRHEVGGD